MMPQSQPCATLPTGTPASALAGLGVFVANVDNQTYTPLRVFMKRQGCTVERVAMSAVRARVQASSPDILLLDFSEEHNECIHALRRAEPPGQHLLVVGFHDPAAADDRERALAAGLDDLLPKPVDCAQLVSLLERLRFALKVAPSVWQLPATLRRQLCSLFIAEWPEVYGSLQTSHAAADWAMLQRRAHYLKNSADVLGDDVLRMLCRRLEDAARASDGATASALIADIAQTGKTLLEAAQICGGAVAPNMPAPRPAAG